jgi:hypothetical protein
VKMFVTVDQSPFVLVTDAAAFRTLPALAS